MRVCAIISYDGSRFKGMQQQPKPSVSVASHMQESMRSLGINSKIVAAGRTDAGVHATAQVVHFDLPPFWRDAKRLTYELNRRLEGVYVRKLFRVNDDFHARFCARRRRYRYIFKQNETSVFEKNYVACFEGVDIDKISDALRLFVGKHDFALFCKSGSDPKSTTRTIYAAKHYSFNGYEVILFEANGFLRSQVRMMVDASIKYARSKVTLKQIQEQLKRVKAHTNSLVPACGLYLSCVVYEKGYYTNYR